MEVVHRRRRLKREIFGLALNGDIADNDVLIFKVKQVCDTIHLSFMVLCAETIIRNKRTKRIQTRKKEGQEQPLTKEVALLPFTIYGGLIANAHGPARSPTVLETPIADSVKADAHCAMEASEAPEHTIKIIISQSGEVLG